MAKYELLKGTDSTVSTDADTRPSHTRFGLLVTISSAVLFCVSVVYALRPVEPVALPSVPDFALPQPILVGRSGEALSKCASTLPPLANPPAPVNLWASLSVDETVQIQKWLESPKRGLNLTRGDVVSDNYVFLIEAYHPPKAAALDYLASPSTAAKPGKFARVTIHHGAARDPFIKDYLVGPLPIGAHTRMKELTEIYHRHDIPFNARGILVDSEFPRILANTMPPLAESMQELLGGSAVISLNDTLVPGASAPWSFDGSFRRIWISWKRNTGGSWLNALNFFFYLDMQGTDISQYKILKIVYNNQVFPSTESFLEAFHNGTLKPLPSFPTKDDLSWSTRKRVGPKRDLDHLPGPRSVSFAGLRFRVDRKLQYVSWMGWGLYLGFNRDMGLSLWDIRFKGKRIIYELAPQEAIAQYAGSDPIQSTTAWLDRFFGIGSSVRNLLPGYDCPHEAVYLPATTHSSIGSSTVKHAICIFEQDLGRPLNRHSGDGEAEFGAVKAYVLTIRSTSTVGNYDYLFDYLFHLDGTIEVRLSASGYLQGAYFNDPKQASYGTKIWHTAMGSIHDHVINFKVDLDVAGVKNSLLHTSISQEETTLPWFDDDWGQQVIQQKISREYITNESDALIKYPTNFQGGYAIVNKDKTNRWGSPRGYAIHPGYSPVHNTVVGSKRLLNNANWARYNLAVSRRKDTEISSSSMWNLHLPGAPVVDFHKFFDGENITQEDLVAWVNIGMHHLPQAEDAPNTRTNTAVSSFFVTPMNYFDSDVSIESTNAILLTPPATPGDAFTFDDYGVKQNSICIPNAPPPFEYSNSDLFDLDGAPQ